jgi:tetraacyldisaccharide 4'-kinase
MRDIIYAVMTDKKKGLLYSALALVLSIVSVFYGLAIEVRKLLYKTGIFKAEQAPIKVVSIGNLTLGGTGKTPFAINLAKMLSKDLKKDAAILIRGYGWDEQAMLKESLPDTPILVRPDRVDSAHKAVRLYGADVAILDDGFQYWELKRDLDIVLIDSRLPFGNGALFPRGVLRESKSAIKRAHMVVFTKVDKKVIDPGPLKEELKAINPKLMFMEARHRPLYIFDMKTRKNADPVYLKDKKVVLLSSIGDPKYFKETVKGLGANVVASLIFKDHHDYQKKDVDNIIKACTERKFDFILTTEKDAVKLARLGLSIANYCIMVLVVDMEIISGRENLIAGLNSLFIRKAS